MGVLKLIGLETKGPYCFYRIDEDSAIIVGYKKNKKNEVIVPEKIGKLTVRGTDYHGAGGRIADAITALDDDKRSKVKAELNKYYSVAYLPLNQLPKTVEYLGFCSDSNSYNCFSIPSHIRYINDILLCGEGILKIPGSVRYLGHIRSETLYKLQFVGEEDHSLPHLPLSKYLGKDVDDVPQIAENAFRDCTKLTYIYLGNCIVKIGENAMPLMPSISSLASTSQYRNYRLQISKRLEKIENDTFRHAIVETLIYPDDLSEALRCRKLSLQSVEHLIIRDHGALEQYTELVTRKEEPAEFPDKCLYYLLRSAKRVTLEYTPEHIFERMFFGCSLLRSVSIGTECDNADSLMIGNGVRSIAKEAFCRCRFLKASANALPDSLTYIGERAFCGCGIYTLTLPKSMDHIGSKAFSSCMNLKSVVLPTSLVYIAPDAFEECPNLRLSIEERKKLEIHTDAYHKIMDDLVNRAAVYTDAADELMSSRPATIAAKQEAYENYRKALEIDPYDISIVYSIGQFIMSYQVPHCIKPSELMELKEYLIKQNSDEAAKFLDSTLVMIDSVAVIISDPDDIITMRLAYGISCYHEAAVQLTRLLLKSVKKHPNISGGARDAIRQLMQELTYAGNRSCTADEKEELGALRKEVMKMLPTQQYFSPKKYCIASELTSEKMLDRVKVALTRSDRDEAFYDAEFWLELALKFNPKAEVPEEFTRLQRQRREAEEIERPIKEAQSVFFPPVPHFPTFTPLTTSASESEGYVMSELEAEYWGSVASGRSGGFTAADIENDWLELDSYGFWDDKSWQ